MSEQRHNSGATAGPSPADDPLERYRLEAPEGQRIYASSRSAHYGALRRLKATCRSITSLSGAGERILDVGCGDGSLLRSLPGDRKLFGVDVARSKLSEIRHARRACALAEILPFADESFDLVVCAEVLEHLPDPESALREISRVCRRGGKAVVTVPQGKGPAWYLRELLGRKRRTFKHASDSSGHIWEFAADDLRAMLMLAGFEVLAVRGVATLVFRGIWRPGFLDRAWVYHSLRCADFLLRLWPPLRRYGHWAILECRKVANPSESPYLEESHPVSLGPEGAGFEDVHWFRPLERGSQ